MLPITCRAIVPAALLAMLAASSANAQTAAYWRFEAGPPDTNVPHTTPNGEFDGTVLDVSGNGNHLSAWSEGDFAGYVYRSNVSALIIPLTGEPNLLSVKNTGGSPGMFTSSLFTAPSGIDIELMMPAQFTIEASFKIEANGSFRTVVGRDAQFVAGNGELAALYFQVNPENGLQLVFVDVSGFEHRVASVPGAIQGFDWPTDPDGANAPWYNAAGVSDGTTLTLYINGKVAGTTNLAKSGSTDTSLARGFTDGGDWHAGGWSVGRGLYNGAHVDRAYGYIDEVRISNVALGPAELLFPAGEECRADFNDDGFANSQDFFDFLVAFFALAPEADFNDDTFVNSQDFFDFLVAFFAGC